MSNCTEGKLKKHPHLKMLCCPTGVPQQWRCETVAKDVMRLAGHRRTKRTHKRKR